MQPERNERTEQNENGVNAQLALTLVSLGTGALLIAVLALVFGRWDDLGDAGQVATLSVFTVASAIAGAWLLKRGDARLGHADSVVWASTVALTYGTATLVTKNFDVVPDGLAYQATRGFPWLVRAVPAFMVALVLLVRERRPAQVLSFSTASIAFGLASYDVLAKPTPGSTGLIIAGVGALTVFLAWIGELGSKPEAEAFGVALVLLGSVTPNYESSTLWAPILGVGAGVALVTASVHNRSPVARIAGILMTVVFMTQAVFQVSESPFTLLSTGAMLVAGGIAVARMLRTARG